MSLLSSVAIIPARGNSKRIPRKNIREFYGKPILAWSIEAAVESGCFNRVIVSTDDEDIASIAMDYGAEVPFVRPEDISDDYTGTTPVIVHAINALRATNFFPEYVCCIYPTAPFIGAEDLVKSRNLLLDSGADYVFPVVECEIPVQRTFRITKSGRIDMLFPEYFHARSQDLEPCFFDAGQFYWGRASAWLEHKVIYSDNAVPIVVPSNRVVDIDTESDWLKAEILFKKNMMRKMGDMDD